MRHVVHIAFSDHLSKPEVDALLAEMGFGPTARVEEIDVETLMQLIERLRQISGGQIRV
jgi:hypothetical protein